MFKAWLFNVNFPPLRPLLRPPPPPLPFPDSRSPRILLNLHTKQTPLNHANRQAQAKQTNANSAREQQMHAATTRTDRASKSNTFSPELAAQLLAVSHRTVQIQPVCIGCEASVTEFCPFAARARLARLLRRQLSTL